MTRYTVNNWPRTKPLDTLKLAANRVAHENHFSSDIFLRIGVERKVGCVVAMTTTHAKALAPGLHGKQ